MSKPIQGPYRLEIGDPGRGQDRISATPPPGMDLARCYGMRMDYSIAIPVIDGEQGERRQEDIATARLMTAAPALKESIERTIDILQQEETREPDRIKYAIRRLQGALDRINHPNSCRIRSTTR